MSRKEAEEKSAHRLKNPSQNGGALDANLNKCSTRGGSPYTYSLLSYTGLLSAMHTAPALHVCTLLTLDLYVYKCSETKTEFPPLLRSFVLALDRTQHRGEKGEKLRKKKE